MQHPDEGVIHTWLDGELPAEEAAAIEAHIVECAECAALIAEARGLIAASSRIVSALDIVPGDVIPAPSLRKRAWHESTQLRAAAAVLIVAGASLIVIQRERAPDEMDRLEGRATSVESAPAAAKTESPQSSIESKSTDARSNAKALAASPPADQPLALGKSAVSGPVKSGTSRRTEKSDESTVPAPADKAVASQAVADAARSGPEAEGNAPAGKVAGAQAPAPRAVVAPPATNQMQRSLSKNRDSSARIDNVVVTGVASAAASGAVREESMREAKLREVKADTTGNVVVTIYELSPGIQLTLTETAPQAFAPKRETDQKKEKSQTTHESVTIMPAATKTETVTWTVPSTGRTYTFSGPLTKEQLTGLRKRLPPEKR